jgi:hypothetical protein
VFFFEAPAGEKARPMMDCGSMAAPRRKKKDNAETLRTLRFAEVWRRI